MKSLSKIIYTGVGCILTILLSGIPAFSGVLGIDDPGITHWSHAWYGSIEDVLILDNDTLSTGISIDKAQDVARIHFAYPVPCFKKLDLKTGDISEAIRWNYPLGYIIASENIEHLNRTLFLSRQKDFSFLIQASNTDDDILRVDELDCAGKFPLEYCELSDSVFLCDNANVKILHHYNFASSQLQTLSFEEIDTMIIDVVMDSENAVVYVLSQDCPGDVIAVSSDDLQVIDVLNLPGNLQCLGGFLDQAARQMVVFAMDTHPNANYLVQVDLETFTVGAMAKFPSSAFGIVPVGFYGSNFFAAVPGNPSQLMRFDGEDLTYLDSINCSAEFGSVRAAALSDDTIVLLGSGYPSSVEVFNCNPFSLQHSVRFTGDDERLYCSAINPVHNQLMISRNGSNPAKLVLVDLETFSRVGDVDYFLNTAGFLRLLASDQSGEFTYGYHTGEPEFLVRIRNDNHQIDIAEPLHVSAQCVDMLVDQSESQLFIIYGQTLARHNLETLEFEEKIVLQGQPSTDLTKLLLDTSRNLLIVSSGSGQVFKVSKSPLQVIDETNLTALSGTITDGVHLADQDSCVYSATSVQEAPARLFELNLESFRYEDECELIYPEFEISSIVYDDVHQTLNLAATYYKGGILSYKTKPFTRLGENNALAVSRFTEKGIFDTFSGRAYWLNSFHGGLVIATHNSNKGFITGSSASLTEAARIQRISLFSHIAAGSVRLAVYNHRMELLWESREIVNTCHEDWIRVSISDGTPDILELPPGEYRLAFQVNDIERITSAHSGEIGDGFRQPAGFGPFPNTLWYPERISDRWALYADWESLFPTMTPTAEPSSTPMPEETMTPTPTVEPSISPPPEDTATPTISASPSSTNTPQPTPTAMVTLTPTPATTASPFPTESPAPSNTPAPTSSPTPYVGVRLLLTQNLFKPGDMFQLDALVTPIFGNPMPVTLWVILDVYGSYWFGPRWTQDLDWYILGRLDRTITERILQFTWPSDCGSLNDIAFWGALLHAETWSLIGKYDRIDFSFQE